MSLAPTVSPLLHLRMLPALRGLPPHVTAALAREAVEVAVPAGTVLLGADEPAQSVHVILDGTLEVVRGGARTRRGPGDEVGLLPVLAGELAGTEARAERDALVLSLDGETLRDASERYAALLIRLLQEIAGRVADDPAALLASVAGPSDPRPLESGLDRVGRLLALHRAPAFPSASMDALAELAGPRSERGYRPGEALWDPGTPADTCYVVCSGRVRYLAEGEEPWGLLGPGAVAGLPQILRGGSRLPFRAVAEGPVVALELEREGFLDVVEDHFELGWSLLSRLATLLLEARGRAGGTEEGTRG